MGELKIKTFGEEIAKISTDIDAVNELKQIAIADLEDEKRNVRDVGRKAIGNKVDVCKELEHLAKRNPNLAQRIQNLYKENYQQSGQDIDNISILSIERLIDDMDKNISRLEYERINVVNDMEAKRRDLIAELESIEQIDLLINALTYKIYELQHSHRKKLEALKRELTNLKEHYDGDTDSDKLMQTENLDNKIKEISDAHEELIRNLELEKSDLMNQSEMRMNHIEDVLVEMNEQRKELIKEYEERLLQTLDQNDADDIRKKISQLKEQMMEEMKFKKNSEEMMLSILEERGIRMTPSGRFLTKTGILYTFDEAKEIGLLEDIDITHLNRIFKCYASSSESNHSVISSSLSSVGTFDSDMDPEDVHYLKKTVANPLVLAIAEIISKQPRDPIHYLGHWLIKYRYNQELDKAKKAEIEALVTERERLAAEKRREELKKEAELTVWDMVYKAVEEALRREMEAELLRIAMEGEYNEEEVDGYEEELLEKQLLEEARDTLGVYEGPPTRITRDWDQK